MGIGKGSLSTCSIITEGMATPPPLFPRQSCFTRLALRLFPKTRSGASMSNCFTGLSTNRSSQSLANKLATLEGGQEKESEAANVTTIGIEFYGFPGRGPYKDHYAIKTTSNGYLVLKKEWVHGQGRPLLDKIFGKDSLQDINAYPAATLPDYEVTVLGLFVEWTYNRSSRSVKTDRMFKKKVCTRQQRVYTIDIIMELLFFAEQYTLHEFQDDVLELLINSCKEDDLPLDVAHAYKCHDRTTPDSKTRAFFIDFVAFIIQEIDTSRNWKAKKAALNCDLSFNTRKTLVESLHSLEGGKIRSSRGKLSDPRDAPVCVYHYHGQRENCPHKTLADSSVSELLNEKGSSPGIEL
ncbi:hypothetical protein BHYA_0035g00110 [Botrytis hyacinthi]|uniref:Uncharacterized protein n=1 Tax=Botrytis hyacinthi TaxID=278943 RepID=A0A4Z1H5P5_9HELO|nr:hypothetical protein BHYA_0035g00110 [Botrytis hyacinthi]